MLPRPKRIVIHVVDMPFQFPELNRYRQTSTGKGHEPERVNAGLAAIPASLQGDKQ
jgi:hypothetical protein